MAEDIIRKQINEFSEIENLDLSTSFLHQTQEGSTFRSTLRNIFKKFSFGVFSEATTIENTDTFLIEREGLLFSIPITEVINQSALAVNWIEKNNSYTAKKLDKVLANTEASSWVLFLPASPEQGNEIHIADSKGTWNTNPLYINGNGKLIYTTNQLIMDTKDDSVVLVFNGLIWKIV